MRAHDAMKATRRKRTVQRELKRWRWWEVRDLRWRWKMKVRERRERRRIRAMKEMVVRSKVAGSKKERGAMKNIDFCPSPLG